MKENEGGTHGVTDASSSRNRTEQYAILELEIPRSKIKPTESKTVTSNTPEGTAALLIGGGGVRESHGVCRNGEGAKTRNDSMAEAVGER
ncbi:hypothetical protein QL285_044288 [Trifolium repens]|jgi:hypothetical protein|nr:hypothetical protein QL285_044288 [Trifolium repens]